MTLAFTNCSVLPCDGAPSIPDAVILVDDDRIQAVDRREALEPVLRERGASLTVHDLGGRWVMPGLMDMHVHLSLALPGPGQLLAKVETDMAVTLRAYRNALDGLQAGVTFMRTLGDTRFVDLELKRAINAGQITGPRLFCAGQAVIVTGGHGSASGHCLEADGADGFRHAVRRQLRAGADVIKIMITGGIAGEFEQIRDSQATFAEMEAACQAAHNAGRRITAHAGSALAIAEGVRAGLDCVEHGYFLDQATVDQMAARGVYLVPTLSVSRAEDYMRRIGCPQWMIDRSLRAGDDHMRSFQLALAAGVPIAMGTDMLPADPYDGTLATYREVEWMVQGGMPPAAALRAATLSAAELCQVDADLGSIAPGKLADLVGMPRNPLDDIRALRELDVVVKDGVVIRDGCH
ncbi:MAG: amidohydrolase family protein [Chloroflexi bacterium]|nr:amidohydrolase family protein [Chloroflexota bacterium]